MPLTPRFTDADTLAKIQDLLRSGPSVATVAIEFGINARTLRRWVASGVMDFESNHSPARVAQAQRLLDSGLSLQETSYASEIPMTSLKSWREAGRIIKST